MINRIDVCIFGDTRYRKKHITLAKDANVLVHEATFSAKETELAYKYYHSTTKEAATLARQANVKQLILTQDRKSTRLNSSHVAISYAVFCLKKKNIDYSNINRI